MSDAGILTGLVVESLLSTFKLFIILLVIALLLPVAIILLLKLIGALVWSWATIGIGCGVYIGVLVVGWAIMIILDK